MIVVDALTDKQLQLDHINTVSFNKVASDGIPVSVPQCIIIKFFTEDIQINWNSTKTLKTLWRKKNHEASKLQLKKLNQYIEQYSQLLKVCTNY